MTSPIEFTQLLRRWSEGDDDALDQLMPLVYDDLHRLARRYMRGERIEHTLQATALVNEAFVRLSSGEKSAWESREHFFAVVARLMRRVLVDFARSRRALKRGGSTPDLPLIDSKDGAFDPTELLDLDMALDALGRIAPRQARVVELRFFGGLSVQESAQALEVSPETIMRDWKFAKLWLLGELSRTEQGSDV